MYSSIYQYAVDHGLTLPKYRKENKVEGYIKLSKDGTYNGFEKVPKEEVTRIWCPFISDTKPAIICTKFQYMFLEENAKKDLIVKHKYWLDIMKEGAQQAQTLDTIYKFLEYVESDADTRRIVKNDICNSGISEQSYLSFRIESKNAEKAEDWMDWFDSYAEEQMPMKTSAKRIISELTGQQVVPITDKFPKNTAKAAGTGFPIYSNQARKVSGVACSFVSYGCVNGIACPMSQEEADAVNAGLKFLLDSDINNDRDFGFIYWYDTKDAADLITKVRSLRRRSSTKTVDEAEKERNAQYSNVLHAVFADTGIKYIDEVGKYHIVEYNLPDKGRVSLSKEYFGTYIELYDSLQKWYSDSALAWKLDENGSIAIYTISDICAVLFHTLKHKTVTDLRKESDIEYGANKRKLAKAMLFGEKIPQIYIRNASEQITRSYVCSKLFQDEKRSRRILLQLIKAGLLREGYEDMDVTLNKKSTSVGYQCGRWFATMVRIQELSANKKLNVSLAERYYRAAKQSPARTLTMVNDLKEHYLSKLTIGGRISMEQLFAEIASNVGETFPEHFTVLEQGAFDLGYAQQRQAFFEHRDKENNLDATTEPDVQ